ncbi:MAG: helix-turn-helix transcriptional regulator [Clostridia bacterium]|nr:helix-turn-helix transcriptional regulator [Clostridia bacterium]
MKANQSNNKNNICGRQIHLIRTGKYDKQHEKISQDLLAARLQIVGLDIDRTAISRIESGGRFLKDSEVLLFAEALKVPIEVLYDSTDNN